MPRTLALAGRGRLPRRTREGVNVLDEVERSNAHRALLAELGPPPTRANRRARKIADRREQRRARRRLAAEVDLLEGRGLRR